MKDHFADLFLTLCIIQFFFPILALMIKKRFKELGYCMKESPYAALFNYSKFWSEARKANKQFEDNKIKEFLFYRNMWWLLALIAFSALVIL